MTSRHDHTAYLHDHTVSALLLSTDGRRDHGHWMPRSLVTEPGAWIVVRMHEQACWRGVIRIEAAEARALGASEPQAEMT